MYSKFLPATDFAQLVQQRTAQAELEVQKAQARELNEGKKRLQAEANDLRTQLNEAKTETSSLLSLVFLIPEANKRSRCKTPAAEAIARSRVIDVYLRFCTFRNAWCYRVLQI